MGQSLCKVLLLHLPAQKTRKRLAEITQRIEWELSGKESVGEHRTEKDELEIDVERLVEELRESLRKKEEVKEVDDDISSSGSEEERNKIIAKRKTRKRKKKSAKAKSKNAKREVDSHKSLVKQIPRAKDLVHNRFSRNSVVVDAKRPVVYCTNTPAEKSTITVSKKSPIQNKRNPIFKKLYSDTCNPCDPHLLNMRIMKCPLRAVEMSFQEIELPSIKKAADKFSPVSEYCVSKQHLGRMFSVNQRKPLGGTRSETESAAGDTHDCAALLHARIVKGSALTRNLKAPGTPMDAGDCVAETLGESMIVRQSRLEKKSQLGKYEVGRNRSVFAGKKLASVARK